MKSAQSHSDMLLTFTVTTSCSKKKCLNPHLNIMIKLQQSLDANQKEEKILLILGE